MKTKLSKTERWQRWGRLGSVGYATIALRRMAEDPLLSPDFQAKAAAAAENLEAIKVQYKLELKGT